MRPAMLIDIMFPLLSILEDNQSAPMPDAILWERQIADSANDVDLRLVYADQLKEWGCRKREADIRREAKQIQDGKPAPLRRYAMQGILSYPPGQTEMDGGVIRTNQEIAHEILNNLQNGGMLAVPSGTDWNFQFAPACAPGSVEIEGDPEEEPTPCEFCDPEGHPQEDNSNA